MPDGSITWHDLVRGDITFETEHVPDAVKAFGVAKAWRFWSLDDPSLHQAMYQFDDEAKLAAMLKG